MVVRDVVSTLGFLLLFTKNSDRIGIIKNNEIRISILKELLKIVFFF